MYVSDSVRVMVLVFVGSGIFHVSSVALRDCYVVLTRQPKSGDPAKRARAIVQSVTHYNNPKILAEVCPQRHDDGIQLRYFFPS